VWVVDLERPAPQQLTSGLFYDHAIGFSPRGDEILFLSNHEPDPDANNNSDIFAVDLGGQVRQITQTKGCEYDPVWSPDGKSIAYTATKREVTTIDSVAEDTHLWVIPATGGNGKELATEQDRRVRDPQWSPDGRSIMYLAGDRGYITIFKIGIDGGRVSRFSLFDLDGQLGGGFDNQDSKVRSETNSGIALAQPFQITNFSFSNRQQTINRGSAVEVSFPFVLTMGTALRPSEVWSSLGSLVPLRRLSAHNDSLIRSLRLALPEEINFPSFDGTQIQGWLMRPSGCASDHKCPLILSIHGGPHGMYGWSFNPAFQVYVARGYAVLYLNPRGSNGYGQKFSDGTVNEWGGGDYRDLMLGVDEVLRKNTWIDYYADAAVQRCGDSRQRQQLDQLLLDFTLPGSHSRRIWRISLGQLRSAVAMVSAAVCETGADADTLHPRRRGQRRSHHAGRGDVHGAEAARCRDGLRSLSARGPRLPRTEASSGCARADG
jgi:hypothetical protein